MRGHACWPHNPEGPIRNKRRVKMVAQRSKWWQSLWSLKFEFGKGFFRRGNWILDIVCFPEPLKMSSSCPLKLSLWFISFGPTPYAQTWFPMTLTHWPLMIPFSPTPNPETSSVVKGVNKHHPSCLHWRPCKRIHLLMVKRRRVTQQLITKKLSFSWSKLKWMVKWMLLSKRCLYRSWGILKPSTAKSESRGTSGPLDQWMKTKQGKKSKH